MCKWILLQKRVWQLRVCLECWHHDHIEVHQGWVWLLVEVDFGLFCIKRKWKKVTFHFYYTNRDFFFIFLYRKKNPKRKNLTFFGGDFFHTCAIMVFILNIQKKNLDIYLDFFPSKNIQRDIRIYFWIFLLQFPSACTYGAFYSALVSVNSLPTCSHLHQSKRQKAVHYL